MGHRARPLAAGARLRPAVTVGKEIAAMYMVRTGRYALPGLVLMSALLGVLTGPGAAASAPRARAAGAVTTLSGSATVARPSRPQPSALAVRDDVFARDRISTAKDSLVRVLLGGKTVVTAREMTVLTIADGSEQARIALDAGGAALDVLPVRVASARPVQITTPNAIAEVRGTVLAVETFSRVAPGAPPATAQRQMVTAVHVLTGVVEVTASRVASGKRVRVTAGQTVEVVDDVVGQPGALVPAAARRLSAEFRLPARAHQTPAVATSQSGVGAVPPGGGATIEITGGIAGPSRAPAAGSAPAVSGLGPGVSGLTAAAPAAGAPRQPGAPFWPPPGSGARPSSLPLAATAQPSGGAPVTATPGSGAVSTGSVGGGAGGSASAGSGTGAGATGAARVTPVVNQPAPTMTPAPAMTPTPATPAAPPAASLAPAAVNAGEVPGAPAATAGGTTAVSAAADGMTGIVSPGAVGPDQSGSSGKATAGPTAGAPQRIMNPGSIQPPPVDSSKLMNIPPASSPASK